MQFTYFIVIQSVSYNKYIFLFSLNYLNNITIQIYIVYAKLNKYFFMLILLTKLLQTCNNLRSGEINLFVF